ncbi:MAG: electron transfer flavoprotein subunit beta/FixA family protein [Gracilibacteraceae bacterium]|nr:electron transfer flavoprotein subunit beta/FixA family protein [Gracilibacteraceae bacterium]
MRSLKIIACYKWTLDEADIRVDEGTRAILKNRAQYRISPYDRNAIECGVQLVEAQGGEVAALTVGGPEVAASLKDVLSRGATRAVWVGQAETAALDAAGTALTLAAAVKRLGEYDLIVCGEGSSDNYAQQTGPRLAELLGIPVLTYASKIELEGNILRVERKLEEGIEVVEAALPALVTVLPDINEARIPGLKQIMAAGKKPTEQYAMADLTLTAEDIRPTAQQESLLGAVTDRKRVLLKGENAVKELVSILKAEGIC